MNRALLLIRHALGVLLVLALMSPSNVFGQVGGVDEDLSSADLETLIQLAREAYEAGDYDTAIRRLLLANRKEPNARLLLNVARSYDQSGDCVRSLVYYDAYTRHPDAEESFLEGARAELAGSSACVGYSDKLSGRLMLESQPEGANVFVNGQAVGKTPRELAGYPAGELKLRFEMQGFVTDEQTIELKPRTDSTVGVVMEKPSARVEPVETNGGPSTDTKKDSSMNWGAIGLMGAGAGALTLGLVYDMVLIPKTDEERGALYRPDEDEEFFRLTDQRNTQANIAIAGYVAGGILLAGGTAWLIYGMLSSESSSSESGLAEHHDWRILPMVDSQGSGVWLMRRF
ncbi:MAG: PEGA domain-containing protein [Bradymonadaceae bacterium]